MRSMDWEDMHQVITKVFSAEERRGTGLRTVLHFYLTVLLFKKYSFE